MKSSITKTLFFITISFYLTV